MSDVALVPRPVAGAVGLPSGGITPTAKDAIDRSLDVFGPKL